jgi:hypothetical protein
MDTLGHFWALVFGALKALIEHVAQWEIKDWLGVTGFFIAVSNIVYSRRKDRREPIRSRLFHQLDELRAVVILLSEEVEKHLCWEQGHKPKEDIYRMEAKARELCEDVQGAVPKHAHELFRIYTHWWYCVSQDGFPMQQEADKFRRKDSRVCRVTEAATELVKCLECIRAACLTGKLKYWKVGKK